MAEVTNEEANELADEILQRDEFLPASEPGIATRALQRIGEEISRFFTWLFSGFGSVGGGVGKILAIVLVVLAALLFCYAVYRAIVNRKPKTKKQEATGTRVVFDEVVEPSALREQLGQLKASSDWRGAVVAAFRLAVVGLIDQNIAREIAGATTGDFARAVAARRPELLDTYTPASAAFERAFYSDLEVHQSDLAHVEQLLGRLEVVGAR